MSVARITSEGPLPLDNTRLYFQRVVPESPLRSYSLYMPLLALDSMPSTARIEPRYEGRNEDSIEGAPRSAHFMTPGSALTIAVPPLSLKKASPVKLNLPALYTAPPAFCAAMGNGWDGDRAAGHERGDTAFAIAHLWTLLEAHCSSS